MPRPEPASPLERIDVQAVELSADMRNRLASTLGRELLPPDCLSAIQGLLTSAREHSVIVESRENKTTPGNVRASIEKACAAVEGAIRECSKLIASNSGIDSESFDQLKPPADAFILVAKNSLEKLKGMPRIYPEKEILSSVCPLLQRIFFEFAVPDFRLDMGKLRRFAFEALQAGDIKMKSIDEAHLDRLGPYLNAEPPR